MTPNRKARSPSVYVSSNLAGKPTDDPRQVSTKTAAGAQTYNSPVIDLEMARTFLSQLDPAAKRFHFRTIPEAKGATEPARNIVARFDDVAEELVSANRAGCAVYVSTQDMRGDSAKAANLKRLRCHWIDIDARQGQKLPRNWKLLPPQIVIETSPGSSHCWFLLADSPEAEQWAGVQRALVKRFRSDFNGCTNVAKLLRVPGFLHQKDEPHLVRVLDSSPVRYTSAKMAEVYTPISPKKPSRAQHPSSGQSSVDRAVLQSALDHLADVPHPRVKGSTTYSDDYDGWWQFGLAIHRAMGEDGFDMWDGWSRESRLYPGRQDSRAKWKTFSQAEHDNGVTVGTIFFTAKRHGWSHSRALSKSQLANALAKFRGSSSQRHV